MSQLSSQEREKLCQAAREVARLAYAPYSKFRVGAAILGQRGIYVGTNVENASYGLTLCAERSAFASAIARGERKFQAIAIACIDAPNPEEIESITPCGACRQWIAELAATAEIIICGCDRSFGIEDLLPLSFRLEDS
ncbi:MAG: cytidine deaminase [Hydrococcus sp. C42_A2020_068]|nr:cytidine deaminase [Hydrococcus sp. C42_A2020_068]